MKGWWYDNAMTASAEKSWKHDPREEYMPFGPGPWDDEPDKVQWIDAATGLDCLAVRNHFGAWCGYIGLPPGHPLHGLGYDDVEDRLPGVRVHGGLTFAGPCEDDAPDGHGICHVPEPGRPADVWWLGFDCGHAFDLQPGMQTYLHGENWTYRDLGYVRVEVRELARQLI